MVSLREEPMEFVRQFPMDCVIINQRFINPIDFVTSLKGLLVFHKEVA